MNSRACSSPLATAFQDCYRELIRFLTRRTGSIDDARELTHDIWVRLAERQPPPADDPKAYLFAMAQNMAVDHLRRKGRADDHRQEAIALDPTGGATPDIAQGHALRQALGIIENALQALPERTRDVFLLHRIEGCGQDELARRFGVARSTIERDVGRASDRVQAALDHWRGERHGAAPRGGRRRTLGMLFGLAAVAGSGGALWRLWQTQVPQWQAALATPRGRQLAQDLPDGSRIVLDAASALDVAYFAARRSVAMRAGAAFFEVARAPARPFVIDAPGARITVLGTRFAVDVLDGAVDVAVESGRVRVEPLDGAGAAVELGAGERLRVGGGAMARPVSADGAGVAPWRDGRLGFVAAPLGEVVGRLERYTAQPVEVAEAVAGLPVNGEIAIRQADEWLNLLPAALPVRLVRADGRMRIVARERTKN